MVVAVLAVPSALPNTPLLEAGDDPVTDTGMSHQGLFQAIGGQRMNLYVSNLSPAVQAAELQQMFAGMGEVLYARLAASPADGAGYAFVYVPNAERARDAVAALNGAVLGGERIAVSEMSERPGVVRAGK